MFSPKFPESYLKLIATKLYVVIYGWLFYLWQSDTDTDTSFSVSQQVGTLLYVSQSPTQLFSFCKELSKSSEKLSPVVAPHILLQQIEEGEF